MLSKDELQKLIEALTQGYASQSSVPDPRLLKLYILERKLSRLIEIEDADQDPEKQALINESLRYFLHELMLDV